MIWITSPRTTCASRRNGPGTLGSFMFGSSDIAMRNGRPAMGLAIGVLVFAGLGASWSEGQETSAVTNSQADIGRPMAYGRFVPERQDDFAWENDKVAFRVYGPASRGQGPVSGVDAWFKKVGYPIIDKWYAGHLQQDKSYHVDHGEGHDAYHVGASRGVGGTAVWVEGVPYPASKFVDYEVHSSGGETVEFTLRYSWATPLGAVLERKRISLALGSRFYRVQSVFTLNGGPASLPIAIGLTTHDEAAEAFGNAKGGWIATWEVIDGHGVGTGALLEAEEPREIVHMPSEEKDASHVWLVTACDEKGALTYRAGFAWQADGEITSADQWSAVLDSAAGQGGQGVMDAVGWVRSWW